MTKDEAKAAIASVSEHLNYVEYRNRIFDILDQFGQPRDCLTVRKLCGLISAAHDNHPDLHVELFGDGSWICGNFDGEHFDLLPDKLAEMTKPEDPEVMVPMRLSLVKCCAEHLDGDIKLACKAALEKAKL